MLKRFIFAAGTLLAVTLSANGPASASTHRGGFHSQRGFSAHRGLATRSYRSARTRVALHSRNFTRSRLGYGWHPPVRNVRLARRGRMALVRRGANHRLARRGLQYAAARRDTAIRDYVGPSSAYSQVSTPLGGGSGGGGGTQVGNASFYSGRNRTASGGFVGSATCAHRSLPFGTRVLVTNLANARQAVLTVNDRGPFVRGRIVDVSTGAAGVLGMLHSGTAPVRVQVIGGRG